MKFTMPDIYHTFRPGHRIMVQVQSSWFPLVDRNPQTFVDIYNAEESDFQKATRGVCMARPISSSYRSVPHVGRRNSGFARDRIGMASDLPMAAPISSMSWPGPIEHASV